MATLERRIPRQASCPASWRVRLRPQHRDHVWRYDFVFSRTHDGRPIRMLTMIDELTRECLAIDVSRRLTSEDVLEQLSDLFIHRGPPEYIRSNNRPEFTAHPVGNCLDNVGVKLCSLNQAVRGRTVLSNHSTENSAMSCSRSSCLTLCGRHEF